MVLVSKFIDILEATSKTAYKKLRKYSEESFADI